MTESILLSLIGAILGLVLGFLGMRALLAVNTSGLPRLGPAGSLVTVDWRVLTFTLGLSLVVALLFGLFPALAASRTDLNAILNGASSRTAGSSRQGKTRSLLVAVETGLAVVLMIGAMLMMRTLHQLSSVELGFHPSNVEMMSTAMSDSQFPTARSIAPTVRAGLQRARSIPGVENAAVTCCPPLQRGPSLPFAIVGRSDETGRSAGSANYVTSSEDYFAAFGIPIVRGRGFAARDDADAPAVAIINQATAKRFWADGSDPLGAQILIGAGIPELAGGPVRQIIGIVGDVRHGNLSQDPAPTVYVPVLQTADPVYALIVNTGQPLTWVARTREGGKTPAAAIRDSIREATGLPVTDPVPMERIVSASVSRQRLNTLLMSVFGGTALVLATIGIHGVLAYSVDRRVKEIGIRMALGGDEQRVKWMVVRQGMMLVSIGVAAGLLAAFYMADALDSFLFEVRPRDPLVFVTVPVVLVPTALVAVWLPARRASRIVPLTALRHE